MRDLLYRNAGNAAEMQDQLYRNAGKAAEMQDLLYRNAGDATEMQNRLYREDGPPVFTPYSYQAYCIDRIVHQPRVGLFLDMGLGKTVITLMAIRELKYERFAINRVLIIAPKKVAESTWTAERDAWRQTQPLRISRVLGSEKDRLRALREKSDIWVINRENVVWLVNHYRNAWPFDMIVIDESSSFKSRQAKRFKALAKILPHVNRLVELTGTPSPNSIMDLWSQVYLLDEGERLGKRFAGFQQRYFEPGWRSQTGIVYKWKPKPMASESVLEKISDICISMKSEDYLQLPERIYETVPVALDDAALAKYRQMERDMVLEVDEEDITALSAAALTGKLLQMANGAVYDAEGVYHEIHSCKLDALSEVIEQLNGQHALIFYQYQHDRDRILQRLGKLSGKRVRLMSTDDDIQAWNRGGIDLLLAHPASAGYGLNLQKGGHHIIWYGLTWNLELYQQANKRLHRQGQKETVIIHHLMTTGTVDEDVAKALQRKEAGQDAVMNALKARIRKYREGNGLSDNA